MSMNCKQEDGKYTAGESPVERDIIELHHDWNNPAVHSSVNASDIGDSGNGGDIGSDGSNGSDSSDDSDDSDGSDGSDGSGDDDDDDDDDDNSDIGNAEDFADLPPPCNNPHFLWTPWKLLLWQYFRL